MAPPRSSELLGYLSGPRRKVHIPVFRPPGHNNAGCEAYGAQMKDFAKNHDFLHNDFMGKRKSGMNRELEQWNT